MQQIINVYKPKGPTSRQVLNQIGRSTGVKKIGHAGTLDPLAEGVLVVALGREATKKLGDTVKKEKCYEAEITLGAYSETDDAEGPITVKYNCNLPPADTIKTILESFIGQHEQTPPIFSAVKIKGIRAYKLARRGRRRQLKARVIKIKKIKLISYHWPMIKIKITTGPGVYVRSLARDLGEKLGTGAYLSGLKRVRVGQYKIEDAILPEKAAELIRPAIK